MNIGLLYEMRPESTPAEAPPDMYCEFETVDTIQGIVQGLEDLGHTVHMIDSQEEPLERLRQLKGQVDLVLNISVGLGNRFRELMPSALCEALGIPYTGSDPMAQALSANKHAAKLLARSEGIATPDWIVVSDLRDLLHKSPPGPKVILKPVFEGSSIGVSGPVDIGDGKLEQKLGSLLDIYCQPILVERFIEGYEVTVPVLGNPPRALPPVGLNLQGSLDLGEKIFDAFAKAAEGVSSWDANPPVASEILDELSRWALKIHDALGCCDLSRSDFRITRRGEPFFVEINATPQISPLGSSFVNSAAAEGLNFRELLRFIIDSAVERSAQKRMAHSQNHKSFTS
jgi:D-alanine-D-alanine ligase